MGLVSLIYPVKCVACREGGSYVCDNCLQKIKVAKDNCTACKGYSEFGATHADCESKTTLNGLIAIWQYQGVIKAAIKKIKFRLAKTITSELMAKAVKTKDVGKVVKGFMVVPIPLHPSRERTRGFNQANLIAGEIAKKFAIPVVSDLLKRTGKTRPQSELLGKERLKNIKNVFAWNTKYKVAKKDLQVLLVDDVYTTGATMNEAAKVLKQKGIKNVWGFVVAVS